MFGHTVQRATCQMAKRMAAENVPAEKDDVNCENDATQAHAQTVGKAERSDCVPRQEAPHGIAKAQKIPMHILKYERPAMFAAIPLARLTDRACRGVGPKCLVIRAAVVITG